MLLTWIIGYSSFGHHCSRASFVCVCLCVVRIRRAAAVLIVPRVSLLSPVDIGSAGFRIFAFDGPRLLHKAPPNSVLWRPTTEQEAEAPEHSTHLNLNQFPLCK